MARICCKSAGLVIVAGLLLSFSFVVHAQNSVVGIAKGRVVDKSGKPIAGAAIRATFTATGKVIPANSGTDGFYTIVNMLPGLYSIDCQHPDYRLSRDGSVYISVNSTNLIGVPPFVMVPKSATAPSSDKMEADASAKAKLAVAARAKSATEAKARIAAEAKARLASEIRAEAERKAKLESDRKSPEAIRIKAEAEVQTRIEAEKAAKAEAQAKALAEEQARLEAQQAIKAEADAKAQLAAITLPTPELPPIGEFSESEAVRMVQSTSPMRGGSFSESQIQALPLTGIRTFDDLALLFPGVSEPPETIGQTAGPGVGAGVGSSGQFAVNGMRSRANNFTVDGSDNNDQDVAVRRQGFLSLVPQPIESVQEFQISTLLWDGELGRNLGSQVNAVSKTGSNQVHGQAYGFLNDSRLNARNFFDYTPRASGGKNPFTRAQMGIALAGPVVRNRTHFFVSYEHQKLNALKEEQFATPTLQERKFQAAPDQFKVITSTLTTNNDFDYVVDGGITPLGTNLLSLYPLPNNAGGPFGIHNLSSVLPASGRGDVFSFKLSQQFTPRNYLSARYNFTGDQRELPSIKRAIASTLDSDARNQNLSLIFDSAVSGSLANQARFSYGRTRLSFDQHAGDPFFINRTTSSIVHDLDKGMNVTTTSKLSVTASTGPLGQLIIRPFSPVGVDASLFPQNRLNNTFQFADTLSKIFSKHSLKFGADIRRVQFDSRLDRNYRSGIEVNNGLLTTVNGTNSTDSFLSGLNFAAIGLVPSILQTLTKNPPDSTVDLRFTEFNLFVNDNYRVAPTFAIDFGFRYEKNTVPTEANGIIESALKLQGLPQPAATRACQPQCQQAFQSYQNAVSAYSAILGGRNEMYSPDNNNLSFHFGFAWDPSGSGKIALRGGYGLYYDTILGSVVSQSRNVFPNEIPFLSDTTFFGNDGINANNPYAFNAGNPGAFPFMVGSTNQLNGTSDDFAAVVGNLLFHTKAGGLSFTLPEKELRTPYVQQWHLTIEKELKSFFISGAYVGTKGSKLTRMVTPNGGSSVTPHPSLVLNSGPYPIISYENVLYQRLILSRTNGALGAYQIFTNSASSTYHAFQLETRKRFSTNYSFTGSYTWSHAIDDVSDVIATAGAPALAQNVFNLGADRGNAGFDVRHRFAGSLIVDLPFYKGQRNGAAILLGGWQLSSIVSARTGQPFTLLIPFDANQDGNLSDRPATTQGLSFFNSHQQRRITQTANTTSYFSISSPSDGKVGRNTVYADSLVNWDLAVRKSFPFTETQRLDFRTEFFNILNRTNFGIPVSTIGDPAFGLSTNTITNSRMIQFALKFVF